MAGVRREQTAREILNQTVQSYLLKYCEKNKKAMLSFSPNYRNHITIMMNLFDIFFLWSSPASIKAEHVLSATKARERN